jgi:hypothetical protein
MINTLPLRLMILHLAQRFRIDGETFINSPCQQATVRTNSQGYNYTRSSFFRPENVKIAGVTGQSGLEVLLR